MPSQMMMHNLRFTPKNGTEISPFLLGFLKSSFPEYKSLFLSLRPQARHPSCDWAAKIVDLCLLESEYLDNLQMTSCYQFLQL